MYKDERYLKVKPKIVSGEITQFNQILKVVPKTIFARDMGTNTTRMGNLFEHPEKLLIYDVHKLCALLEIEHAFVYAIIDKQIAEVRKHQLM